MCIRDRLETFIAHLADITDRPIQTTYLIRQSNLTQDVGSTFIKEQMCIRDRD